MRICEDVERRKRDVSYAAELGNDVYPLAQGPLSLLKEEVDVKGRSSSTESAGRSSLFYPVINIVLLQKAAKITDLTGITFL